MIELTQKGRVAYKIHERFHNEMVKQIIDLLDEDEERILISSVQKLCDFFNDKSDQM